MATVKQIKDLKFGDFFRLKDSETSPVWVREEYFRDCRRYNCHKFDDVNHEKLFKGTQFVFVDFSF